MTPRTTIRICLYGAIAMLTLGDILRQWSEIKSLKAYTIPRTTNRAGRWLTNEVYHATNGATIHLPDGVYMLNVNTKLFTPNIALRLVGNATNPERVLLAYCAVSPGTFTNIPKWVKP